MPNIQGMILLCDGENGVPLAIMDSLEITRNRTGAATEADVVALVRAAVNAGALMFRGIQCYSGNLQHIPVRAERRARALAQLERLRSIIARLRDDDDIPVDIVSGAGTGTFDLDPEGQIFTELQVGSYVFMDVDYQRALKEGRNALPFETALFVATSVVSINADGFVTTDGGLKCFATDGPKPAGRGGALVDRDRDTRTAIAALDGAVIV